MELAIRCHLIAAALHFFSMESVSDTPHTNGFSSHISQMSLHERTKIFQSQMETIISNYVISREFSTTVSVPTDSPANPHAQRISLEQGYGSIPPISLRLPHSVTDALPRQHATESIRTAAPDGVFNYASAVLNDGLLLLVFKDAIREGDGPRILRCWKVLLMYFQHAKHKNYQKEAFHLLAGVSAAASQCVAHQLTWSHVVNTSGGKGKNVPLDLHMEHLNRTVKEHIVSLGANVAEKSILQCGQSLKGLIETCENFDKEMQVRSSSKHTKVSGANDEKVILKELTKTSHVFDYVPGRVHPSFKTLRPSIAEHIDKGKLLRWIKGKKKQLQDSISTARIFNHPV